MDTKQFEVSLKKENICVKGLRIGEVDNRVSLVSRIEINPTVTLKNVSCGTFYYDQLCQNHSLVITTANQRYEFPEQGQMLTDSPSLADSHFYRYFVAGDQITEARGILQPFVFIDTPFLTLLPNFQKVEYNISFETWLQYGAGQNAEVAIFRFDWCLNGVANNIGGRWQITQERHSTNDEIMSSVQFHNAYAQSIDVRNYPKLKVCVLNFFSAHPELKELAIT